jgi:DNA-binding NtrC family response regulator
MEISNAKNFFSHHYDNMSLEELEKARIAEMLNADLTKDEMARRLKIARSTLYLKIKKYGLQDYVSG